jgi:hypothetical protein
MSEIDGKRDRDERLRAEPGEPAGVADLLTAAAYRREVERLRAG